MHAKQGKFHYPCWCNPGERACSRGWKTPKITKMMTKILNKR